MEVDYVILKVRYHNQYISQVRVCDYQDGTTSTWSRDQIIASYYNGDLIYTGFGSCDDLGIGALVQVVNVKGKEYIRTVPNQIEKDNLGELPEF